MSPDPSDEMVAGPARPSMKKKLVTLGILGGIMLLEAVGIFVLVRMTSEPGPSEAGEAAQDPGQLVEQMDAELALVNCEAINRKSGQSLVVHISLSVRVAAQNAEHAAKLIEKRQSTIKDRVQMILRSADPQHLNEPNLDTIKRQVRFELDKILGDAVPGNEELILKVLIPQILQTRSRL